MVLNVDLENKLSTSTASRTTANDRDPNTALANSSAQKASGMGHASDLSHDLDDILSSFSSPKSTVAEKNKGQRQTPRFRAKWRIDIVNNGQSIHSGFSNDISTLGASIYLNSSLLQVKSTFLIHVPPHSPTSKSHVMEISGNILYVVYDGSKQLFRVAVNFLRFNQEADRTYLGERLTKHHLIIPEF